MVPADQVEGIDPLIAPIVRLFQTHGIETFESCQGGEGHFFAEPTVRFSGQREEGFRALAVAQAHGLAPLSLRRYWTILDGEPVGPNWEMTFRSTS